MDYDELINALHQIGKNIEGQNSQSFYKLYEPFFQFGFTIVSVFLGAVIAYIFTKMQSKKEFKKHCYISYLNSFNNYLADINNILMDILKINKLGSIICREAFLKYQIIDLSNYYFAISTIKEFRYFLIKDFKKFWEENTLYDEYYNTLLETANRLVNFDTFIEITTDLQKNSINYYYIINDSLREKYDDILQVIYKNTTNNMQDFNIENFKRELVEYIKEINNVMLKL